MASSHSNRCVEDPPDGLVSQKSHKGLAVPHMCLQGDVYRGYDIPRDTVV